MTDSKPVIIPIAGGKGGAGKSLMTANLAVALARAGKQTVAVDLDLGASNLHTFLGIANEKAGIGDFIMARENTLENLRHPTVEKNLTFIPGDGRTPFMANIAHTQKLKLIRSIRALQADYILLDLGAGSSFNTLDYFLISDRGILTTTPEMTSVMNTMVFVKHLALRIISRNIGRHNKARDILNSYKNRPIRQPAASVIQIVESLSEINPMLGRTISDQLEKLQPRFVFNFVHHPDQLKLLPDIARDLQSRFGVQVNFFGHLFYDRQLHYATGRQHPHLLHDPASMTSTGIERITERIINHWHETVSNSAELLAFDTRQHFEKWQSLIG